MAQTLKIGYVNSAKILQEYPDAIEAQKKIDAQGKSWQAELQKMSNDLQDKYAEFQKKSSMLTDAAKKEQQDDLVTLEQKGQQFKMDKFGQDGALAQLTDSLLSPIKKKVMKVIEAVAKEQKLNFVFDRNDQILVLLYGDIKSDYTNLVIDHLKRVDSGN
jgi:outer membrane protein